MSKDNYLRYHGSRNFVSEHVYDAIWERPEGTKIEITFRKDGDCEVVETKP